MRTVMLLCLSLCLAGPCLAQGDSMVVTLLGTGTPNPQLNRLGPATLVEAGGLRLLFDAGRGTSIRLEQAGVREGSVDVLFITHHHSDHTNGVPDVWLTGWLAPFGDRHTPLRIVGPTGTVRFARGLEAAYAEDVRLRVAEERRPPEGARLVASEFARDTVVFDERGVRVESFLVDHGGELRPAYGYRVRYGGRSVVISGDTRYNENVIRHARGADVLVHEVAMAPAEIRNAPFARFILAHHTSPTEAARVFEAARPRLAVFTHFGILPNRVGAAQLTEADVLAEASRGYAGRIVNGEDLMRIVVGDSVRVASRAVP